jgi:lysophospholipase L1-like esterase
MSAKSTEKAPHLSASQQSALLTIFVSLIVAAGVLGGFFIGRHTVHDAYIKKVANLLQAENSVTTLYQVLGGQLDDPLGREAFAKLYDVPPTDRAALETRLRAAAWVPPYRPAPFVGHMSRPMLGTDPHINVLGFRDERQTYISKPEHTVRIFLTGGSTAWGSGASSQTKTISCVLEQILNQRIAPTTGYRYEVINTAFPGWSTTQEKILIQQRLVNMHPDVVLMFSGSNDVHWTLYNRDIRWFYGPQDENYMMMINEIYNSSSHPEWKFSLPASSGRIEASELARITARNVEDAAIAAGRVKALLIFALQPNVVSTTKRLSKRERQLSGVQNKDYWNSHYQALRTELGQIKGQDYRFLDLSKFFGELDERTELFVDSYHFADLGYRLIAQALADEIDWQSIQPNGTTLGDHSENLSIVSFEPSEWKAGQLFHPQSDGTSTLRLISSRSNKNLLVVFDHSIVPTIVGDAAITASIQHSLYKTRGQHTIYLVDGMTGETSDQVVFQSR